MDASSSVPSSSAARPWMYDLFLSFRGPDTRRSITSDLYDRLQKRGIKTFMDDQDLQVGDGISSTLIAAIEKSRFAIVVLSENYADSAWCLEELTKICECKEESKGIFPLFYNVDPSDVRHRKRSFGEALNKHGSSGRHASEKVQRWNDALYKVASFSGWHTKDYKTDRELVVEIVDFVCSKIQLDIPMSTGDFEEFEATKKAMDDVVKALKDDKVTAIGVYGMGGVGKTTMVKHVAAQSKIGGIFDYVIIGVVSQSPDLTKIQGTLADTLGITLAGETEFGRAARLHTEIMRREKILIILDDVWMITDLSKIGIPSFKELQECNSKVVLTTRKGNVCYVMKCQASIPLNILSEQDSWTLFVRNTSRSFESPDFYNVARKVAGECGGLPIALIAVARALGDKELVEWKRAAKRLEKSQFANPDHDEDAFKCIKLSYDYLKDEDYKSCFLLCCLFPEDYDIPIEELFRYAIGKGLFRDYDTIYEARGIAHSVVKHLKDSSLLLEGEFGAVFRCESVKMHDAVRDTAMKIAKREDGHGFLVKAGWGLDHWSFRSHEDYSAISLMGNNIRGPPEESVSPKLQILSLQFNTELNEIPETFFPSSNELMLLDLGDTSISSLPQSFSLLTNLQALFLDSCENLIDISIVGKLTKLEILTMREYPGGRLPREIGNLTNLRILEVSATPFGEALVTIPSKVISKLHKLEELYMLGCGIVRWGCKIDGCGLGHWQCTDEDWRRKIEGQGGETNIGFDELAGLSCLKVLQVSISYASYIPKNVEAEPKWVYFDIHIGEWEEYSFNQQDHNSRSLYLRGYTISTLPDWFINVVTEKTEKLKYENWEGMTSDILMEYDHGRLHELEYLRVDHDWCSHYDAYVLMNTTRRVQEGPVFEKLKELHLTFLDHLEALCVGELPPGSFSNLKVLQVYCCDRIKNVSKFVQRLPNLEKLDLNNMRQLEYVFKCEGFEPEQSKLREMHLLGENYVKSICSGPAPRVMFQSLKSLIFYNCEELVSLFASDVAECLVQLEDLFVERCRWLYRVIEAVNNKQITVLRNLKNMVLKDLPMLYSASCTVDIECPLLERLFVVNCPHISFSTSASAYFGSTKPVQLNDSQLYDLLRDGTSPFIGEYTEWSR
ncbi:putative toll-like receptor, P-loop containing nucleoside triphosphate hydrolase [Rosa chinensis]|uniref:Putative toll-like receptor, P-loop containing nucleoside triphosphate hydrolase n=1 Tax=Rosa chinensis TaxID=74649 RepID=A0A2P6QMJ0_ROSCH|nr:disease resistance protein At4g27190 [Rosa chinensis]PRQ35384.1 putative toll-like receptor, P-loop containing nucleoside triphosphate hydrolase [Rosa chinensis]